MECLGVKSVVAIEVASRGCHSPLAERSDEAIIGTWRSELSAALALALMGHGDTVAISSLTVEA